MQIKPVFSYLKTILIGGLFFVAPFAILIIVADKLIGFFRVVVSPISDRIPIDGALGEAISRGIAGLAILLLCFGVGLLSGTRIAGRWIEWVEENILTVIPGYSFIKGMGESLAGLKGGDDQEIVLIDLEETWQIGFLIEQIDDELSTVYLPGAPNPMSGSIVIVKKERLKHLDISTADALKISGLGTGSKQKLGGKISRDTFKQS